jgi:hypothetical protein
MFHQNGQLLGCIPGKGGGIKVLANGKVLVNHRLFFAGQKNSAECRNHFTEKYLRPPLFPTTFDNRVFKLQVPRFQVRQED